MSKNTKTPTTKPTANDKFVETLISVKSEMKTLRAKFKADLQALYDNFRKEKNALREKRAAAWKIIDAARTERKAARKAPTKKAAPAKKVAAKKPAKKAAK